MTERFEEWRPVRGFESAYAVSNMGIVKSVDRYVKGRENSRRWLKGVVLTPRTRPDGTLAVNLWQENSYRQVPVRRIVLDAFDGPQPRGFDAVNIDEDPTNNRLSNLEWQLDKRLRSVVAFRQYLNR